MGVFDPGVNNADHYAFPRIGAGEDVVSVGVNIVNAVVCACIIIEEIGLASD